MSKSNVVILGAGFAGLSAAKAFKNPKFKITIIDKNNYHLFQPLLYQVATAGLSPSQIASPIRYILRNQENCEVLLDQVMEIVPEKKIVRTKLKTIKYDFLIVALGSQTNFYGKENEKFSRGLKTIEDALFLRKKILKSFELAEVALDSKVKDELLNFVIIGGGPTGVEMAGAIVELAKNTLKENFRNIDPSLAKVFLVEGRDRILSSFPEKLSRLAQEKLEKMGVEVLCGTLVTEMSETSVTLRDKKISTKNIIWAAGVKTNPIAHFFHVTPDPSGRVAVDSFLRLPDFKNVYVVGDGAAVKDSKTGEILPGLAPVALQEGRFVARHIESLETNKKVKPFIYRDKGMLATIGRSFAVAQINRLLLKGFFAWLVWGFVHILYLIGFRNKLLVLIDWSLSYITYQRGSRLIVSDDEV